MKSIEGLRSFIETNTESFSPPEKTIFCKFAEAAFKFDSNEPPVILYDPDGVFAPGGPLAKLVENADKDKV
jgi:hypothetical protein